MIYSPTLMAVQGNYDQVNRSEVANTYGVLSALTCAYIPKAQNTWL